MSNVVMQWYDKLFFAGLAVFGAGGIMMLIAFWGAMVARRS